MIHRNPTRNLFTLITIMLLVTAGAAQADTFIWDGGHTTLDKWNKAENWVDDTALVSSVNSDVVFNAPDAQRLTNLINNDYTIGSLTFNTNGTTGVNIQLQNLNNASKTLTLGDATVAPTITVQSRGDVTHVLGSTKRGTVILGNNLTVTIDGATGTELTIGRPITGDYGITKEGTGVLNLSDNNTYSGGTTVSEGVLNVTGSILDVTVGVNGTLTGDGAVGALDLFGTIAPGLSPGTMDAGNTIWNDGANFEFEIDDATGAAGGDPGWDLLAIDGTLDLTGLTDDGFEIDIISLSHPDHTNGDAANFDSLTSYEWEFVSTTAGITGFDADDFVLDDSLFTNDLDGGAFSVEQNGNSLEIVFTPIPEPGTLAILGLGGVGMLLLRRRRHKIAA